MHRFATNLALSLALALAMPLSAAVAQVSDDTPIIEAGGQRMTKGEFEGLLLGDPRYQGFANEPGGRRALATTFARAFTLETEARRRKLDESPAMRLKIRHAIQQMLAYQLTLSLRASYMKDEAALSAHHAQHRLLFEQPRVRQLLVRVKGSPLALRAGAADLSPEAARAKAQALRARLEKGADFATLAKQESDDLGSRSLGGDMGYLVRGASGAEFEAAAYSLPIGTLSQVIQTEQGFHVLRVEARNPIPLADVRAQIANELAHRDLELMLNEGFKLNEAYFKP
jgi:PPIC-type PPIASE domain